MSHRRRVFFVSDSTGLTVEALGSSLISQFDGIDFVRVTLPFIDSPDKAREAVAQINAAHRDSGKRPLVFSSLVDDAVRAEIDKVEGLAWAALQSLTGVPLLGIWAQSRPPTPRRSLRDGQPGRTGPRASAP